jgi:hypothetical protein
MSWAVVATGFALTILVVARVISMGYGSPVFQPVAAGQAYSTPHGSIRLVGLEQTASLSRYDTAGSGAVYVVATMEASVSDEEALMCLLRLVQDDGRSWSTAYATVGDAHCPTEPTSAPVTFKVAFLVPQDVLGRLAGVAVVTEANNGRLLRPAG